PFPVSILLRGLSVTEMSSPLGGVSADVQPADLKKPNLRKAFNLLKTHAAAVANFTLQWQDLEDHFHSIHESIEAKLQQLQSNQNQIASALQSQAKSPDVKFDSADTQFTPTLQSQDKCKEIQFTSKETQLVPPIQSQFDSNETESVPALKSETKSKETQVTTLQNQMKKEESLPENASFNGIPIYDGKELLLYVNEHLKDLASLRNDICNALKLSVDSGKLVLEAMKWFYLPELKKGDMNIEVSTRRKNCVLLLEELMKVRPLIKADVSEEAVKLALEWKANIRFAANSSLEVYGFLLLLGAFGLMSEFDGDEVLKLFDSVKQRKQAPELFRALGFADDASDFIQKLILQNKRLDAVRFIHAFELVDEFPPVPLLKAHLKDTKKFARMGCKGKKSLKAQDEATGKEIAAIKAVIRCVNDYNLGSQYSPDNLRNRIQQLRKTRKEKALQLRMPSKEREVTATASGPKDQVQQWGANKRTSPKRQAQSNQQNRKKHPRKDALHASENEGFSTHLVQPSYHQPAGFFVSQGAEFYGMATAAPIPNVPVGANSAIHTRQPTHHHQHPESSLTGQDVRYLAPSAGMYSAPSAGMYSLSRSSPDSPIASLSAGRYGFLHSGSVNQHRSSPTGPYGLLVKSTAERYGMGSAGVTSFAGQYGTSTANGSSTGRIGSAGFHSSMRIAPESSPDRSILYYTGNPSRIPNYYDRYAS
ncbi:hypothetical protein F2P56_023629, partial [Juglans regia]